jgi:hypothetical protein
MTEIEIATEIETGIGIATEIAATTTTGSIATTMGTEMTAEFIATEMTADMLTGTGDMTGVTTEIAVGTDVAGSIGTDTDGVTKN